MSDYKPVQDALAAGVDPAMLCQTCPWDRLCVSPPTMTRADVDAQIAKASADDDKRLAEAKALGRDPGLPMGALMTTMIFAGKDTTGYLCPVFALRLRSGSGRQIADSLRAAMQSWDDES